MKVKSAPLLEGTIYDEQIALETRAVDEGVERYHRIAREAVSRGEGAGLKPVQRLMLYWMEPFVAAIREERRLVVKGEPGLDRETYGQALLLIEPERAAVVTLQILLGELMLDPDGVRGAALTYAIGRAYIAEANYDLLKEYNPDSLKDLDKRFKSLNPRRVMWWAKRNLDDPVWGRKLAIKVGAALYWLLANVADAGVEDAKTFIPAFKWEIRRYNHKNHAYVSMHPNVYDLIQESHEARQFYRPRYLPMIVPPFKWTTDAQGGYIKIRTPYITKPVAEQKAWLAQGDLSTMNDCLDAIAVTAWRVNKGVLAEVESIWEAGGDAAGICRRDKKPIPPVFATDDPELIQQNKVLRRETWGFNARLPGHITNFLGRLDVADRFRDHERIWFPHQLDFRGRCYPVPPFLNHQGEDLCRGLLEFGDEVEPDDRARWWLKVHLANCYGIDKVSYDDRVSWATGRSYDDWEDADKPFQALAAALSLTDSEALSRIPIQVDGTQNGLQHYGAMLRDPEGAMAVNLVPGDKPVDVYMDVAEVVDQVVEADASDDHPEALLLVGKITRKLIKRPVMTTVYGVTIVGATKQILDEIEAVGVTRERRYKTSQYLARSIMKAVRQVCPAAFEAMQWLSDCAKKIVKSGDVVKWTTPLGLPVLQPYRKRFMMRIGTVMGDLEKPCDLSTLPPSPRRQVNGFAPNFVHSLDACHMFMVARRCRDEGIPFAAVHDAYWCHAANMDRLQVIIREEFVELHKTPRLDWLREQLVRQYPEVRFEPAPVLGTFDLNQVLDSPYFFN